MINTVKEIFNYFPNNIYNKITECKENLDNLDNLEEIRVRTNRNIILKIGQVEYKVNYVIDTSEILEILQRICENSIYTYQNQICNGFITIKGGHRVRNYRKCSCKRWRSYKYISYI